MVGIDSRKDQLPPYVSKIWQWNQERFLPLWIRVKQIIKQFSWALSIFYDMLTVLHGYHKCEDHLEIYLFYTINFEEIKHI